ncbi:MAG TPA: HNH endonuclease [Methanoregulaceae archaeon]|nr:HNH endonuclease [Methanoregulaceae archaeon]
MSPVKVFPILPFPDAKFDPIFQSSFLKTKPLKWSEARRIALYRDRTCRICGSGSPLTVHHMWPRGLGGGHEIGNLVTLCEPCHQHLCSACSRVESARVPGWVKPDLYRLQGKKPDMVSEFQEISDIPEGLSGIFSGVSMAIDIPKKLIFFWELTESSLMARERSETD